MTKNASRYREKIRPAKVSRHYNRFRSILDLETNQDLEVLTTRYAHAIGHRPSHVEKHEKYDLHVYDAFYRMVYFDQASSRFFKAEKWTADDLADQSIKANWDTVLKPIDGPIWDCHESQSESEGLPVVTIQCIDGYPMQATTDNGPIWDCMQDVQALAHMLRLDKKKRKSPRK